MINGAYNGRTFATSRGDPIDPMLTSSGIKPPGQQARPDPPGSPDIRGEVVAAVIVAVIVAAILGVGNLFLNTAQNIIPKLWCSNEYIDVPMVTGYSYDEGVAELEQAGLESVVSDEQQAVGRSGIILEQNPKARTQLNCDDTRLVQLTISQPAFMPDVLGDPVDSARAEILATLELDPEIVLVHSQGEMTGVVIDQNPAPESQVRSDDRVILFVATDPPVEPASSGVERSEPAQPQVDHTG